MSPSRSTTPSTPRIPARVVFVGAGPGDPGLLTVRAAELLAAADAVVIDQVAREAVVQRWGRDDVDVVEAGHGDHGETVTPPSSTASPRRPPPARAPASPSRSCPG